MPHRSTTLALLATPLLVTNARAQQIDTIKHGDFIEAGRYAVHGATGELTPGTYYVELQVDQERLARKVVIVK